MTENKIIQILKDNRMKGIGYKFMPEEVQKWIYDNFYKDYLVYFNYQGEWTSIDETNLINTSNYQNHIFSLSEDFELKKETEGEWVEFEIREDGYFNSDIGLYLWFDWQKFLKFSYNQDIGFTAFGGWRYKNDDVWYMSPRVDSYNHNCHCYCNMYKDNEKNIIPSIPVKIRFWRISK